jgi:ATP-dependent Clp protease ATP-binding subunit ClpC
VFERYTESARRVIFFGRHEASRLERPFIETEHLLLAILRQRPGVLHRLFADHGLTYDHVAAPVPPGVERVPSSVEIPFSQEVKRVLFAAMEEADRLAVQPIDVEHLLLGLLHQPESVAGRILQEHGLELESGRRRLVALLNEQRTLNIVRTEADELLQMLDQIELVAAELLSLPAVRALNGAEQRLLPLIRALRSRLEGQRT